MELYVALLQCARTEPPKATESRSETLANKPAGMQRAIIHKDNRRRLLESAGVLIHRALNNEDATPPCDIVKILHLSAIMPQHATKHVLPCNQLGSASQY